jgi:chemotaxis protein MotB
MLTMIGGELARLPNQMRIEGHTDARPYSGRSAYTNWELSADRANAARRILTQSGVPDERILQIRGLADRQLRMPDDPLSASNRRISILVMFADSASGIEGAHGADSTAAAVAGATGDSTAIVPVAPEAAQGGAP